MLSRAPRSYKNIAEPKPDGYVMTVSGLDLQLNNFYNIRKEISLLRKNRENIGPSTGKLLEHINEDYIKEFINKDFVNIVCNSKSSSNNSSSNEIPSSSISLYYPMFLNVKLVMRVLNPILLHTFWWEHASST
ncbi:hypothetical protein RhiirC2_784344 [Rhizophagus irregularis]|uniref:Uncharacterized protein n=1 Tax=Rhizophagus irregularis TaxID=588596 RepID=A0A2N1MYX1_9GLOM|nr:hypothetical protein RhiirC2_784344 [Rhizophagus irregularis]